jgi:hypothetical protein
MRGALKECMYGKNQICEFENFWGHSGRIYVLVVF